MTQSHHDEPDLTPLIAEIRAPASLRERVAELEHRRARSTRRGLATLTAGASTLLAAAIVAISLSGSGAGSPTLAQAAVLGTEGATLPSPGRDQSSPTHLRVAVDGQAYPYWDTVGWQDTGQRRDRVAGREATTVFYSGGGGTRIAYTIVSGPALAVPASLGIERGGVGYSLVAFQGSRMVTWRRGGHTCILVGRGVPADRLLRLASLPGAA
jgi:hypothetical protein